MSMFGRRLESVPGPLLALSMFVVYLAFAQYVIKLNDPVNNGAGFWPAAGVALGVLLLLPERRWPWIIIAVVAAEVIGDLLHGYHPGGIFFWAMGNAAEPVLGAFLIRRWSPSGVGLAPIQRLLSFFALGVVAAPLLGATLGSIGTVLFYDLPALQAWPKFFMGDALGVLVMAPAILCWNTRSRSRPTLERVLLPLSLVIVTLLVFRNWSAQWDATLPYLVLPFLLWAGLRFGVRGASIGGLAVANIANAATAFGYGPFALVGADTQAITLLQVFLGIALGSVLILGSLVEDLTSSHEVEQRLAAHNLELEHALEGVRNSQLYIRKLEGILPVCMSCKSVRSDDDSSWIPIETYLLSSEAFSLSHGFCPDCEEKALSEVGRLS